MSNPENLLKMPSQFSKEAIERFYPTGGHKPGYPLPWAKVSHCRIRPSELSIFTGINGHGKSMLLSHAVIMGAALAEKKSLVCSLEMKPEKSLHRLIRQVSGKREPNMNEIGKSIEWLDKWVCLYDMIGTGNIPRLLNDFDNAVANGVEVFVIDSLMCLGIREEDHTSQKESVHTLQLWAQQNNVHLALVAHSRKGSSEADKPGKMDVLGSSHITNMADVVWSIWRNKPKETKVNGFRAKGEQIPPAVSFEYDAVMECSKSREGDDEERMYGFYYDTASLQYRDEYSAEIIPLYQADVSNLPF
jgi:twinkle protein